MSSISGASARRTSPQSGRTNRPAPSEFGAFALNEAMDTQRHERELFCARRTTKVGTFQRFERARSGRSEHSVVTFARWGARGGGVPTAFFMSRGYAWRERGMALSSLTRLGEGTYEERPAQVWARDEAGPRLDCGGRYRDAPHEVART
jgi:hypothetical protein